MNEHGNVAALFKLFADKLSVYEKNMTPASPRNRDNTAIANKTIAARRTKYGGATLSELKKKEMKQAGAKVKE